MRLACNCCVLQQETGHCMNTSYIYVCACLEHPTKCCSHLYTYACYSRTCTCVTLHTPNVCLCLPWAAGWRFSTSTSSFTSHQIHFVNTVRLYSRHQGIAKLIYKYQGFIWGGRGAFDPPSLNLPPPPPPGNVVNIFYIQRV